MWRFNYHAIGKASRANLHRTNETSLMYSRPQKLNLLDRGVAIFLLIAMMFQLGACQCGCLEHNAWVQLIGFCETDEAEADEHHHAHLLVGNTHSNSVASTDQHHECGGQARPQFVDNSYASQLQKESASVEGQAAFAASMCPPALRSPSNAGFLPTRVTFVLDVALRRPELQVYRL